MHGPVHLFVVNISILMRPINHLLRHCFHQEKQAHTTPTSMFYIRGNWQVPIIRKLSKGFNQSQLLNLI